MDWARPPAICPSTTAGLITVPQSSEEIQRWILTKPVSASTSTTQALAALANVMGGGW